MITTMATVGLHTLGCKVSQYETEAIAEDFERHGYRVLDFSDVCDYYVINTCTVTAESDRKSRQMIRRAKRRNPNSIVIVCGCYSQYSPDEVAKIPGVNLVVGTLGKMELAALAGNLDKDKCVVRVSPLDEKSGFEAMRITGLPRTRVYVKIEDGCESKCTYCAISGARGRVRSKPREDVISEVEDLYRRGNREIVLTGIETGSYGRDFDYPYDLGDLLCELDKRGSAARLRLGSLAPELVGQSFAEKIRGLSSLAPHFHISIQSGSNNVLARMKRRYTRERALENINRLREYLPGATFTTDLMVGFPGETEEDFRETVDFVRQAKFLDTHVFAYSKRHSTPAADYPDQIPEDVKRRRSDELIKVSSEVRQAVLDDVVSEGRILSCIFESRNGNIYAGHSREFFEIECASDCNNLHGSIVDCRPVKISNGKILVEII